MGYLYLALLLGFLILIPGTTADVVRTIFSTNILYWGLVAVTAITVYSGVEYFYVNRNLFSSSE
jgi:CDP-diacylglycerol--glycerol-3-phosphate 3-phosphatidyltransferase